MRRPNWWPAALWPGTTEPPASRDLGSAPPADAGGDLEASGKEPVHGRDDPWPSFLDLLVDSLGAASGAVWRLEDEKWSVIAEAGAEGWSGLERGPRPARGHPFTWSVREDLILQIPADRVTGGELGGWAVLVPEGRGRRLVELWFPSAPSPPVRGATTAIQAHLRWLGQAADRVEGTG